MYQIATFLAGFQGAMPRIEPNNWARKIPSEKYLMEVMLWQFFVLLGSHFVAAQIARKSAYDNSTFIFLILFGLYAKICFNGILQMGFPFWRIGTHTDLINLHHALDLGHL